jgi:hypothetical protein
MLTTSNTAPEAVSILSKYLRGEIDKTVKAGIFVDGDGLAKIVNLID